MSKITHKITATNSNCRFIVELKINEIISKEQFKKIVKQAKYNSITRTASVVFYSKEEAENFAKQITDEINDDSRTYKIEYKKEAKESNKMSFEDFCEQYLDQDIALMSEEQRQSAYKSYKSK